MRPSGRQDDELRAFSIQRHYTRHAEGSVLISCGETRVLCTASVENRVPSFLRGSGEGWVTAEYGMLPRSTGSRMRRTERRDPAPDRTQPARRRRPGEARRDLDPDRLRRAAGGRWNPDRVYYRRICGDGGRLPMAAKARQHQGRSGAWPGRCGFSGHI